MNEFDHANNAFLNAINTKLLRAGEEQITLQELYDSISDTEYQSYCAGWFLAKGFDVPEDCSKESNLKENNYD